MKVKIIPPSPAGLLLSAPLPDEKKVDSIQSDFWKENGHDIRSYRNRSLVEIRVRIYHIPLEPLTYKSFKLSYKCVT